MSSAAAFLHDEAWLLLPWWVNATLTEDERRRIDDHLAVCPECREEAARCSQLASALAGDADLAPSPHPERVEGLIAAAVAEPADPVAEAAPAPPRRRPSTWLRPGLAWPVAASLLVAAGVVWSPWSAPEPAAQSHFRTLGATQTTPLPPRAVRVVFAPSTTEATMREILLGVRGRIVAGPSSLGAYTVELPTGPDADPLRSVVEHLRSRPEVRFAEPIGGS